MQNPEKVIQIATTTETENAFGKIFILTNKGRVFAKDTSSDGNQIWKDFTLPDDLKAMPGPIKIKPKSIKLKAPLKAPWIPKTG